MKNSEIRQLTTQEIIEQLNEEKDNLTRLRINHKVSDLENPLVISESKKIIARYKTELRAREIDEAKK
ncbi:MAG: 50S ribosomal protein L29 [Bacteroidota bacterium]|nr:50S ribosomal protein L29 [Bacteroidota bacterium]